MYRLLNTKSNFLHKLPIMSTNFKRENGVFKVRLRPPELKLICTACIRNQSTTSNTNFNLIERRKKKRTRAFKPYSDLLVVTETTAKQRKAPITMLTWNDLKILSNTDFSLTELYKIKDLSLRSQYIKEHTYNNLNAVDNELQNESGILSVREHEDEAAELCELSEAVSKDASVSLEERFIEESIPVVDALQPEVIEEPVEVYEEASTKTKTDVKTLTTQGRLNIATRTLGAYLEMCSVLKNPNRGLSALLFHRHRVEKGKDGAFLPIKNIKVYNALLKGFAGKGDIEKLEEVVRIIRTEKVKLNIQSYLAILECYGRNNYQDHYLKQIRIYAKEAANNGFSFDVLLSKGLFLHDEREVVLKAMRCCERDYIPKYLEPIVQYNNHLVNELNDPEQLIPLNTSSVRKNNGLFSSETMENAIKQQLEVEKEGSLSIKSVNKPKVTDDVLKYRKLLSDHHKNWEEAATKAFIRDLSALTAQRSPLSYEPFMRSIPVKDFVTIIVDEAKKLSEGSETFSPVIGQLHRDLGFKVYERYILLRKQKTGVLDKVTAVHNKYCMIYADEHDELDVLPLNSNFVNARQKFQRIEHSMKDIGASLSIDHCRWTPPTLVTIGKFLYRIVMHDLKIDVSAMNNQSAKPNYLPAFYTIFRSQGRIIKEEVKPHPVLSRLYKASAPEILTFSTCDLPMFCPPLPWTSVDSGGYLATYCNLTRLPSMASIQQQLLAKSGPQLYPSLDALNQLGAVPWKVNTQMLDVILQVFNKGGSDELDVPVNPCSLPPPQPPTQNMDKVQRFNFFKEKIKHRRKMGELYSLWCDCLYRLSLANHFRDKIFWLPHNMDFRGRVYPIPPHLNHLGSDLARSLLVFAEGRPLGRDGLNWLKLHLINLTGLKKRDPIAERIAYAEKVFDDILDSADKPLDGRKWWAQSEEPWQTLACCVEIAKAVRSENPETFKSHFPVHQDGSCNGLQHYAALGRDSAGAYSVNLTPSSVPQDVYSAVVGLVEEQRQKDALKGLEVAKALEGFVKRKVIKQTIMTTVYGVTKFGARLQIAKQLKDVEDFPQDMVWTASTYLAGSTFDSLRAMFVSSRKIQDWFTDCAKLIASSGQQVEWVTPMGLPIVQPYVKPKVFQESGVYRSFRSDQFEKPNVLKQKNAFAPNFVHSLDSSHMMLTALHSERTGITFVSVHDCYWTHPSTVSIMNTICRQQFVALHSEPILENLCTFFTDKYSLNDEFPTKTSSSKLKKQTKVFKMLPEKGDFDINQVLQSTYFLVNYK